MKNLKALACMFVAAAILAQNPAVAADPGDKFPGKLVTLVVPFTPASGSDIIARIIAPKLSARWGQPVIVDNKPGASGNIGAQRVASAAPDGYTLLMAINTLTITPALYKNMSFDPARDFTPIAKLAEASYTLAVHPSVPATDMPSLIAYIKKNSGKVNYATPGNGTPQHLAMELFKSQYGLDIAHIPYKGIQGAITDLIGGQVSMMVSTVYSMSAFSNAGKVRMLAVTGKTRSHLAPNVPTFKEQGIAVMDNVDAWYAVLAPPKTSPDLIARLNRDFTEVMNASDVKSQLEKLGLTVRTNSPAELGMLVKSDLLRWQKVISEAGITAD